MRKLPERPQEPFASRESPSQAPKLEMITLPQPGSPLVTYLPVWGLVVLVIYYTTTSLRAWLPFRHIPGLFWRKISYPGLIKASTSGWDFERYTSLNHKYGGFVQIAPETLITDDPDTIRRMSAARSEYTRSA